MNKTYQSDEIFKNIEKILYCAEDQAEYGEGKLTPFYYNRQKGIKLFQGDSLEILKRVPDNCIEQWILNLLLIGILKSITSIKG